MLLYARNQKIHIAERRGGPWGKKEAEKTGTESRNAGRKS